LQLEALTFGISMHSSHLGKKRERHTLVTATWK
jgi:hypothetical protein